MPPKPVKEKGPAILRPTISNSSLLWVPDNAIEGYQERIDHCVDWTLSGSAIRHHNKDCLREDIPSFGFTKAYRKKLESSILNGFLDENSALTPEQHWDITLPLAIWEAEVIGTQEKKICFKSANNIADNQLQLIKISVTKGDREILKKGLKETLTLRVSNIGMTHLDEGLKEFEKLTNLSLCGNYIQDIDCNLLPEGLRVLELQANRICSLDSFTNLPRYLLYLGLAKNMLSSDSLDGINLFPRTLAVLDLSDNDIYNIEPLLDRLCRLPNLTSLLLYGNPCSVCAAYAITVVGRLHRLEWLDNRQVLNTDRPLDVFVSHHDDLRSAFFNFSILRIISAPMPPKPEKGAVATFHVEMQLPLLDPARRSFLMFRRYESLEELLPLPEDGYSFQTLAEHDEKDDMATTMEPEAPSEETDIYEKLEPKNSKIIHHYTTFESNRVPWAKVMTFQEPAIRLFCPDLRALRDTFRSTITLKLIYTLILPTKKSDKKSTIFFVKPPPTDFHVTIATIKCSLRDPDWSQPSQHFHWDDSLGTVEAIHWGDGDLNAVPYIQLQAKPTKVKQDLDPKGEKLQFPENLTCHFGFGVDTIRPRPI